MLSAKQRKAIELIALGEMTLEQIAAAVDVSPRMLYNWRQKEEFSAELNRRIRLQISRIAPKALRRMEELINARSETVSQLAAKDILDRAGFEADSNVNINGGATVNIINDLPRPTQ